MSNLKDYHQEFLDQSISRLRENQPRLKKCLHLLMEDQIWIKENPKSNSIGNLMLHVCGNIRQYVMSGIDGQKDVRKRDKEFETSSGKSRMDLENLFDKTLDEAIEIIGKCTTEQMLETKEVQVYKLTVLGIILHVTEHLSYHTGQVATMTKAKLNKDLGFYADLELN